MVVSKYDFMICITGDESDRNFVTIITRAHDIKHFPNIIFLKLLILLLCYFKLFCKSLRNVHVISIKDVYKIYRILITGGKRLLPSRLHLRIYLEVMLDGLRRTITTGSDSWGLETLLHMHEGSCEIQKYFALNQL